MTDQEIVLKGVRVHNLKGVDLTLKNHQLIVFTGVSGSGKSSLAFDTIYVEGQRRYIESLSTHARRHLDDFSKPDADLISGLSPTIAIEQKSSGRNPRSSVGTMTGIYDYLRVLFARLGTPHCPISGEVVKPQSKEQILQQIEQLQEGTKVILLAPYAKGKKGEFKEEFAELLRKGFTKVRLDGAIVDISDELSIAGNVSHDVDLVIDRLTVHPAERSRLKEAVMQALEAGKGMVQLLNVTTGEELLYSEHAFARGSGQSYGPLQPHDFSFNHPEGMCPACQGLGVTRSFRLNKIIDPEKSIAQDCCSVASSYATVRYGNIYDNLAKLYGFSVHTPWKKLSEKGKKVFLYGTEQKWTRMQFVHPVKKTRWTDYVQWRGVLFEAGERYAQAESASYRAKMQECMEEAVCPACHGERIKPYPAATRLNHRRIAEITALSIEEALAFFKQLIFTDSEREVGKELVKEILQRLAYLREVGLDYLTLDRTAPTLSGGETQRVRLAAQIGAGLVGATYVLDEPSIGLHPRDNHKLLQTLQALRDQGNTVIVVEHDEETICAADTVVDVGPLAGQNGGRIVAQGSLQDILSAPESITGQYLSGKLSIPIPKKRKPCNRGKIGIKKACHHNLKGINVDIPLGVFVAITGVSGSGKSSLITDTLYPALANHLHGAQLSVGSHKAITGIEGIDKVIAIDQLPIGRTPRSNAATYIKLFDEIRDLFSQLPESVARGFKPGRFSFNVKEGSCPHCSGMGMVKIDMDFLEDEWVTCSHCQGKRFDRNTLSVVYKGKNIHDVLEMPVSEAHSFFHPIPSIRSKLDLLLQVGLNYIRLGQPSPTLSGGEAQRIKLAKELARTETGNTFYILDEPTTGLHFHDIHKLIQVLQLLVEKGNTVLVIEHNMDLVKTADWVIDLGPEGGIRGGKLIGAGKPEQIAKGKTATAEALYKALHPEAISLKRLKHPLEPIVATKVEGARQNNLKAAAAEIPRNKITVCTGPSGSGKSSFAFETVYAEGQRRYVESLSPYARQFIKQCPKPNVERIEGLMAAIAIEQKHHAGNPRSTIGTMTEIYDFLRVLYAHLGTAYCPETGEKIQSIGKDFVLHKLLSLPLRTRLQILAPLQLGKGEAFEALQDRLQKEGFLRIRLNGQYFTLDNEIPFQKERKNTLFLVIDRLEVSQAAEKRLLEAIELAASRGGNTLVIDAAGKDIFFNLSFASESTGKSYAPITPHTFSFNTQQGMCPDCLGLGIQYGANLMRHSELFACSPLELIEQFWQEGATSQALDLFAAALSRANVDPFTPLHSLSADQLSIFFHGDKPEASVEKKRLTVQWQGLSAPLSMAAKAGPSELRPSLLPFLDASPCLSCDGSRLNPLARHVRIGKTSIVDLCRLPIEQALSFITALQLSKEKRFLRDILEQVERRLHFLQAIGIGYLSLDRSAPTLSGGEVQRIHLARQLGSGLTGCLYVLDEPTIGLHPHDNERLNQALKDLCSLGNTLLLVEHDPLTIAIADYILDFGPQAGKQGGEIVARGTLQQIKESPDSLTGAYLSGEKRIPLPKTRRRGKGFLLLKQAAKHNLKGFDIAFPLGTFTCVTGVSGSGKSTLVSDLLRPAVASALQQGTDEIALGKSSLQGASQIEKLIVLEQNPIGHTIRSDVSTYVDLLTPLRYFYASLPQAKAKGLQPKHFSFNHRKGMCSHCWGLGTRTIQLQFLPPVKVTCEVCQGLRLNPRSLEVGLKGKNLGEVLKMSVDEAREWLVPIPKAVRKLETLQAVGLGYVQLGQEIATLSGGEAQRLRLSRELGKWAKGKTLYLFDEPTIGLHAEDISKLLTIFHALVDKGHTVILVEHHLDVIANADYLIDLGPGAGDSGGELIASGTPEEVARHPTSYTAQYLLPHLEEEVFVHNTE